MLDLINGLVCLYTLLGALQTDVIANKGCVLHTAW